MEKSNPRALGIPSLRPAENAPAAFRSRPFGRVVRVLILLAAGIATTVLLGWILHLEPMKRIVAGLTSMNPVTAICFEILCVVLWILKDKRPTGGAGQAANIFPIIVLYVGLSKLLDLSTGSSLCPDALLFKSQLDYGQPFPSRMAPNVALSFTILSIAMIGVDRPRWPKFLHPQWLVTPILCMAIAALVGYCYNTSGFYAYKQYIPMALHSAFNLILLSVALILSRPEQGYMRLIPVGSPGARSYARLLPACILAPSILGGIALLGSRAGFLDGLSAGASFAAVLTMLALSILAFLNSVSLNNAENIKQQAEDQLKRLVQKLDEGNRALQIEITERKKMEARAHHLATHDDLTGLPNRLLFIDRFQQVISSGIRKANPCALFFIDVDNFKPVNDQYGHQTGDDLLRALAARLSSVIRPNDTIARLGGDEFAVIMGAPANRDDALVLARRLIDVARPPFVLKKEDEGPSVEVTIGLSVGIALCPTHAQDLDSLVRIADGAMYQAKGNGKNQYLVAS